MCMWHSNLVLFKQYASNIYQALLVKSNNMNYLLQSCPEPIVEFVTFKSTNYDDHY